MATVNEKGVPPSDSRVLIEDLMSVMTENAYCHLSKKFHTRFMRLWQMHNQKMLYLEVYKFVRKEKKFVLDSMLFLEHLVSFHRLDVIKKCIGVLETRAFKIYLNAPSETVLHAWLCKVNDAVFPVEHAPDSDDCFPVSVIPTRDSIQLNFHGFFWLFVDQAHLYFIDPRTTQVCVAWPILSIRGVVFHQRKQLDDRNRILELSLFWESKKILLYSLQAVNAFTKIEENLPRTMNCFGNLWSRRASEDFDAVEPLANAGGRSVMADAPTPAPTSVRFVRKAQQVMRMDRSTINGSRRVAFGKNSTFPFRPGSAVVTSKGSAGASPGPPTKDTLRARESDQIIQLQQHASERKYHSLHNTVSIASSEPTDFATKARLNNYHLLSALHRPVTPQPLRGSTVTTGGSDYHLPPSRVESRDYQNLPPASPGRTQKENETSKPRLFKRTVSKPIDADYQLPPKPARACFSTPTAAQMQQTNAFDMRKKAASLSSQGSSDDAEYHLPPSSPEPFIKNDSKRSSRASRNGLRLVQADVYDNPYNYLPATTESREVM